MYLYTNALRQTTGILSFSAAFLWPELSSVDCDTFINVLLQDGTALGTKHDAPQSNLKTVCVCVCVCVYVHMYVCMYKCIHVCMYVCMYVYMYVCVYKCMYVSLGV